ncbi:CPBP family intramembrane glutamic endopeptidase [Bergeyella zoohelcum]|uniref:CPBP family intramembrane glutamic endopeptidase n=1 Tax=Bergeyella zoohelcum TaxID=1015 RepID=UPI002A914C6F|nr:CPBP family intramembrane glutamic endopeptidase [Bergeyella zoohelcum]MDY6025438.1 CPBP family intramembrane glutamic endopeptidase [Bergeyella zoohelcum]
MKELQKVNWYKIIIFYFSILIITFLSRKLPNLFQIIVPLFTEVHLPWNFNHGFAILIVSILFYKFYTDEKSKISFLGNQKVKALLFPIILFTGYTIYGFKNNQGVDEHIWAFIFCFITFIYNIMEEYTWRGYLIENLGKLNLIIKSLISGIFWAVWHVFIFNDFEQYGGFYLFLIFCIVFSILLTFSVLKTKSLIVPITIHTLLIKTNIVTLICLIVFLIILTTWNKIVLKRNEL